MVSGDATRPTGQATRPKCSRQAQVGVFHHPVRCRCRRRHIQGMRRLEDRQLVSRAPSSTRAAITPLKEDGSGDAYTHPGSSGEAYFKLPYAFWTADQRWYQRLDLAETAVLLITLTLGDGFLLPSV